MLSNSGAMLICSESSSNSTNNEQTTPSEDVYLSSGDQYVVLHENGLKITYVGRVKYYPNSMEIPIIIENNSGIDTRILCGTVANGWQTHAAYTGSIIKNGAKAKQSFFLYFDEIDFTTYEEIQTLQLIFTAKDEYGNCLLEKESAVLHPNADTNSEFFLTEDFVGEWREINNRDMIIFNSDGTGRSSYVKWSSSNSYSKYDNEIFTWKLKGDTLAIDTQNSTFRKDINGSFDIAKDGDFIKLEKNGLVFIKPPHTTNLSIGDSATTDMMSFSLTQFQMAQEIYVNTRIIPTYLKPCKDGTGYNAGDNLTYALPEFEVMNLDKEPVKGSDWEIMIDYNNGFIYYGNGDSSIDQPYIEGAGYGAKQAPTLKPLVKGKGKTAIEVSKILQDDHQSPLKLIVRLPSHEFGMEYFEYDLRLPIK